MSDTKNLLKRKAELIANDLTSGKKVSLEYEVKRFGMYGLSDLVYQKLEPGIKSGILSDGNFGSLYVFDKITDGYSNIFKEKFEPVLENLVLNSPDAKLADAYAVRLIAAQGYDPNEIPPKFKNNVDILKTYYERNINLDKHSIDDKNFLNAYNAVKNKKELSNYKEMLIGKLFDRIEDYLRLVDISDTALLESEPFITLKKNMGEDFKRVYKHAEDELVLLKHPVSSSPPKVYKTEAEVIDIGPTEDDDVAEPEEIKGSYDDLDSLMRDIVKSPKNSRTHMSHPDTIRKYLDHEDFDVINQHGRETVDVTEKTSLETKVKEHEYVGPTSTVSFECPKCGAEVGSSSLKCSKCGVEFEDDLESDGQPAKEVLPAKKVYETTISVPVRESTHKSSSSSHVPSYSSTDERIGAIKDIAALVAPFATGLGIEAVYLTALVLGSDYMISLSDNGFYQIGLFGGSVVLSGLTTLLSFNLGFKVAEKLW